MYKYKEVKKSSLKSVEKLEGEPIEFKIERIVNNGEPITDGAPNIYTERKEGVLSAYNIRTDRWEVAADAMNIVAKNIEAKRDGKATKKDAKVIDINKESKSAETESAEGTNNK
jgi:hypothetical protein